MKKMTVPVPNVPGSIEKIHGDYAEPGTFGTGTEGSGGFTLIETLLAVTLFTIVIISSSGVFFMGIQIWKRTTGASHAEHQAVFALEKIGQDIRSALPVPPSSDLLLKTREEIHFEGKGASFLLPAVLPVQDWQAKTSYQYGAAGYAWDASHQQLCRMTQNATQVYRKKDPVCAAVLPGVQKARFQYWISSSISKTYSWYDEWKPSEGLPQAIRVNFEVAVKNRENVQIRKFEKTFWIPAADAPIVEEAVPGGTP